MSDIDHDKHGWPRTKASEQDWLWQQRLRSLLSALCDIEQIGNRNAGRILLTSNWYELEVAVRDARRELKARGADRACYSCEHYGRAASGCANAGCVGDELPMWKRALAGRDDE